MGDKHNYRRRHYFIKKDYQFKFILKFCLIVFIGALISTALLLAFSQGTLTSSFENSRLVVRTTAIAILPTVIYTYLITLALISLVTIIAVLLISHKIAGPIFRFEKELREIGSGNLTKRVVLRKNDQIKDLAQSLNDMTESLRQKLLDLDKQTEGLIDKALEKRMPSAFIEEVQRLRDSLHDKFKIRD